MLAAVRATPAFDAVELVFGVEVDTGAVVVASIVLAALVLLRGARLLVDEERLRRGLARQNELKEVERLKDDFVASVSHELERR